MQLKFLEGTEMQQMALASRQEDRAMDEELLALQAENRSLQLLVGELLISNQQLRDRLDEHQPFDGD